MANEGFNGTKLILASAGDPGEVPLLSVSLDDSAAEIDVTGAGDAIHTYVAGLANPSLTFEVVGVTNCAIGDEEATCVVSWFDGSTTTITGVVVTAISVNGSVDGAITSSITLRPDAGVVGSGNAGYEHV